MIFLMFCRDGIACDLCRQTQVVKGAVVGIKSALGKRLAIVRLPEILSKSSFHA